MISIETVRRIARRFGATVDAPPGDSVIYCDAPTGYRWDASDCHVICAAWDDGDKQDAYASAIRDMKHGIIACGCEDCQCAGWAGHAD